jgi:hypothetical protein
MSSIQQLRERLDAERAAAAAAAERASIRAAAAAAAAAASIAATAAELERAELELVAELEAAQQRQAEEEQRQEEEEHEAEQAEPEPEVKLRRKFQPWIRLTTNSSSEKRLNDERELRWSILGHHFQGTVISEGNKWYIISKPFGEHNVGIKRTAPSSAISASADFLSSRDLIPRAKRHPCGWAGVEAKGIDGQWHTLGDAYWGLTWNATTGKWSSTARIPARKFFAEPEAEAPPRTGIPATFRLAFNQVEETEHAKMVSMGEYTLVRWGSDRYLEEWKGKRKHDPTNEDLVLIRTAIREKPDMSALEITELLTGLTSKFVGSNLREMDKQGFFV